VVFIGIVVACFFIGQVLVDIALILAALVSLISFALLGYAAIQVVQLVRDVRAETQVLAGTARESLGEIQGTARFINESIIAPVSQTAAFVAATRAILKSLTEPLYRRKS
jgi:hypothetical protein